MNERAIRNAASMYALVAEMEAVKATLEALKAECAARQARGEPLGDVTEVFESGAKALSEIASRLRREI